MNIERTSLGEVCVVSQPVFTDSRGFFTEVFHSGKFALAGLQDLFVQDNASRSVRHTLRGLHYQTSKPQGKLIRVVTGMIFDVAVDIRRSSPMFGKWVGIVLTEGDGKQVWIPPGFAHGFLVMSDIADVTYKCTTPYDAGSDRSIAWDDADIGIQWPLPAGERPLLSAKDTGAPTLRTAVVYP